MAVADMPASLPCGVALAALVDQIVERARPSDPGHQSSCAYCASALLALGEAWEDLRRTAHEPVALPEGLGERIMIRIRSLAPASAGPAMLSAGRGRTVIGARVIAQVASRAALTVPGVALASLLDIAPDPGDRSRVRLSLRLAIVFGPAIHELLATTRVVVSERVGEHTGLRVTAIDIAVEDVVPAS